MTAFFAAQGSYQAKLIPRVCRPDRWKRFKLLSENDAPHAGAHSDTKKPGADKPGRAGFKV